ncbi:hypothetical protein SDC9_56874 [bioreactor metagenome]|uniref:B3/B4 tRNA-binding domain-containing protein n=1 Tax=bioreactor metagenome TaxID=1076179 RepID=A0A644X310_9ZZZZ
MDIFKNETGDTSKCSIGILLMENVRNESPDDKLMTIRQGLEDTIRSKYGQTSRGELKALHPMDTYVAYYKKFGYSYHVLSQFESIIKGKSIPSGLPLVEAMFMAELKNMLLTAGHDFDKIKVPMGLSTSTGKEGYMTISGKAVTTVPGDFALADQEGILSSILRGPDLRTAIRKHTTRVLYTVYAPQGVIAGI